MTGYRLNQRNRYECNYCSHKSWKTYGGVNAHIEQHHAIELERDQAIERAERAEKAKDVLSRQLADATIPKAQKERRYSAVVYCPNCLSVDSVRIVEGQKIGGGGCFRCGLVGGFLVEHVNVRQGDYQIGGVS